MVFRLMKSIIKRVVLIIIISSFYQLSAENAIKNNVISMSYLYNNFNNVQMLDTKPIDIYGSGIYSTVNLTISSISIVNEMYLTTDSISAAKGIRKSVKNLYGFTNRALITYNSNNNGLKNKISFGRDYFEFGPKGKPSLLISKESRPFDQFRWEYKYKMAEGGLTAIQLDNIGDIRRYLTVHFLKLKLPWNLDVFWGESILYTGKNRSVEFQYFNPVILWSPELIVNTTGDANGFLYGGFEINYFPTWQLWGELLVDDYQINKEVKGDLEPNEIGIVAGIQKTGFPFDKSITWLEYTRITNRTYQTPKPEETYTHRGYPIGHYLGNDFDLLQLHYEQKLGKTVSFSYFKPEETKLYFDLGYLRDGANGMDTPFDTPWEDSTVTMETGYSEPFPTGPVTYYTELEAGVDFTFKNGSYLNTGLAWQRKGFQGEVENDYSLVVRLSIILSKRFNY